MNSSDSSKGFLPNLCAIRMVFAWVITAQLLAIVLTLAAAPSDFWVDLSLRSLYIQWIGLSLCGLLCWMRIWLNQLGNQLAGILAWLLVLLVTSMIFLISRWLLGDWPDFAWQQLISHVGISAIVGAIVLRYLYELQRQHERQLAESRARVQALQARIRPHFLFNSMNTIASLTRVDAELAEQVVEDLSDLFRASLSDASQASTLGKELALAEGYLRIESQRLGDRLKVAWDLQDLPMSAPMPALLLQPLLENAVYHGVEPSLNGGEIEVVGRYRRGVINLSVSNNLPEDNTNVRKGHKIAQANVRERLQANFSEQADMRVGMVDGRYQVRLFFPFEEGLV